MKHLTLLIAGAALTAASVTALADDDDDTAGHSAAWVSHELESQGYRVTDIDGDDDGYDVEATRGGHEYELTVDARTGRILDSERDDDVDHDDDNDVDED